MSYKSGSKLTRLVSFKRYCEKEGYELLPDDYVFIDKTLNTFSQSDFKAILDRYLEEWHIGMLKSSNVQQMQGNGRKNANLWLLQYVDLVNAERDLKDKDRNMP